MPDKNKANKTDHYRTTPQDTTLNTPRPAADVARTPRAAFTNAHPKVQFCAASMEDFM